MNDPGTLKNAIKCLQDGGWKEKTGVHEIILKNSHNVLDIEIAIPGERRQLDFAAIQETDGGPTIGFYEAKHINNTRELRSKSKDPKVLTQMRRYTHLLETYEKYITKSYRTVCKNLYEMNGLAERHPKRHAILKEVANRPETLTIDTQLRLVVFGKLG